MTHWVKIKDTMIHDYSLAGHLLSPNSKIIVDAVSSKSAMHVDAVNRLICKLIVPTSLTGSTRKDEEGRIMSLFWKEHNDIWNQLGMFQRDAIWSAAEDKQLAAHIFHKTHVLHSTKVLGMLACLLGGLQEPGNWNCRKSVEAVEGNEENTQSLHQFRKGEESSPGLWGVPRTAILA